MRRNIQRPIHQVFNDGFLYYGHDETQRNSTGKRIGDKFIQNGMLAYQLMDGREEDYEMANTQGNSLDLKVKTPFPPSFYNVPKTNLKVYIEDIEYHVITVDFDRGRRFLFFYLQEVGVADE
ncbi:phage head-tail adapter protein [Pontibacillus salicampi]|uniref:Phage head-tail adapter protein n=1 Tax=Pontibacillus salicampi TaxID=1449801 RepID=A0ABV6LU43_9BACI